MLQTLLPTLVQALLQALLQTLLPTLVQTPPQAQSLLEARLHEVAPEDASVAQLVVLDH